MPVRASNSGHAAPRLPRVQGVARGRHRAEDSREPEAAASGATGFALDDTMIRPGGRGGESTLLALAVHEIGADLDTETILARTVELSCAITGAEHAMLGLSDADGDVGRVVTHGDPAQLERGHSLSLPLHVDGRLFATLHLGGRTRPFQGYDVQRVGVLLRAAGNALGHVRAKEEYAAGLVARERDRLAGALGELDQAAREIVEQGTGALGFPPHLRLSGSLALLPTDLRGELLSALGEALAGLRRHPDARSVVVEVDASERWLLLTVTDDGARRSTAGTAELRARAERLGGVLRLTPVGPVGTRLSWLVPTRDAR